MTDNLFKKPGAIAAPATEPLKTAPAPVVPPVLDESEPVDVPKIDELTMLKQRATLMGIKYSNNIGLDALRTKVNAAVEGNDLPSDEDETQEATPDVPLSKEGLRSKLYEEQMKLVRVRVTCMDPKKKDLPGEIFTVGNKFLGTIRKFVPFGEMTDNGFHIPYIIYNMMKEREFVQIRVRKTPRGEVVETTMAREFALEVLPPLTQAELTDMKAAQQARGDLA